EQVGGTVTHKLDIINSVGAQLTRAQRDRLANFETITRIYNNRTLEIASIQVETVLDDFNTISYSNNNGTQPWLGDWSESGESTNPDSGDIKIPNSYLRIRDNDRSIQRPVNLSGSSSAILSFDYRRVELDDSSDYVAIEISSDDGESWTELDRFAGPNNDSEYAATSYDISDYATSNTIIRFRTSPSLGRKDKLCVDNLLIEWIVNSSANSLAGSSDSSFNIIASDLSTHETVREEFNALSYNSSDGTQSWSNNWQEIGETDGAENGRIQIQPMAGQSSAGSNQAMWSGSSTPVYSAWDTSSFGEPNLAPSVGSHWRIMAGASAPTRDEKIVIGVESDNDITGEMWNGSSWNALPINPLGSVSQTYWRGFEVAYEQQSGDALLVWNDNPNLKYSVWTGSSWTTPATITAFPGNEPQQMRLAANPNSDEMVLVVNDASENDYALVWDGTSWGNLQNLDSSTGDDRIDIFVTYEQQSGNAMVVYGKSATSVYYRIWNGSSWSAESSIAAPSSTSGNVHRTTLAADPSSNRIVLGVVTFSQHIWLSVWDGSTWELATLASTTTSGEISSTVAAAFESQSGKALAAYGGNTSAVQYRAWDATNGWASEQTGFNVSNTPNSMMLDADPGSDQIMLSVQDSLGDLNFVLWDGASWDATNGLSTNTEGGGYMDHPFVFLWSQQQVGQGHCATTNCLTIGGLNQDFNGVGIIRQLDLSHAVEATLSFSYLRQA
ncbi:MAG: hypothetical protein GY943_39065, partial [Chloroflexi bacterium]|nr:hypothetical protein [Chloroflexota bacterium]